MTQTSQAEAFGAPIQQWWSESIAMALAGTQVVQAQAKKAIENALELAATTAKANMKCAEEMSARMTETSREAEVLLRQQAALLHEFPADPLGASQRLVAGYVEGSRKSLDFGVKALTSWAGLMGEAWMSAGKLSEEAGQAYVECVSKLQEVTARRAAE